MSSKIENYKKTFNTDSWPGLESINKKRIEIYGDQEPLHYATILPYELGGEDPLWAVECFSSVKQSAHFHYISLGFTNLYYDESYAEDEENGFGFEITFRYRPLEDDIEKAIWPVNFIQNIAKYVFKTGKGFNEFHYMSANGPIRSETETEITAFAFFMDPEMEEITTPHGNMKFLQLYGITTNEYADLRAKKYSVKQLIEQQRENNPLLITDLTRR